jgi:DNA-binding CsgD family transcriptional regulator
MSLDEMSRLRANGLTCQEIAAELGCGVGKVHRALSAAGLLGPPRYHVSIDKARALLSRGYSMTDTAALLGCTRRHLRKRLRAAGVPALRAAAVTDEERAEMAALWSQGLGLAEVARQLHRDPSTVRSHLLRAGVYEPRRKGVAHWDRHPWKSDARSRPRSRWRKTELTGG